MLHVLEICYIFWKNMLHIWKYVTYFGNVVYISVGVGSARQSGKMTSEFGSRGAHGAPKRGLGELGSMGGSLTR